MNIKTDQPDIKKSVPPDQSLKARGTSKNITSGSESSGRHPDPRAPPPATGQLLAVSARGGPQTDTGIGPQKPRHGLI